MTTCLFCLQPIHNTEETWEYNGQLFPCHPGCKSPIRRAIDDFRPVPRPEGTGACWAHCSVTEQDYDYKWERLPEHLKEPRRASYNEMMAKVIEFQVAACKAYAACHGLAEPTIIRECGARPVLLKGMKQIVDRASPGDHVLIPNMPRTRGTAHGQDPMAIMHTIKVAGRLAKAGLTLHMVYNSIDWNNPIGQQFVRLAAQAQQIHKDTRAYITDYKQTDIHALYGFNWEAMQSHHIFNWVITNIRDKGMSPIEVAKASKKHFGVIAHDVSTSKSYCVGITRDKAHAATIRSMGWRRCFICKNPVLVAKCPKHDIETVVLTLRITRGLQFIDYNEDFLHTATTLWNWYCSRNPEQDKFPWKARTGIDEPVG